MSSASLTLRIAADINDFSKKLNQMTRDVDKAAQKVADIGKSMMLGITLPAGLAAVALGKMAVENESVGNKMQRTFGPAVGQANLMLERMMKVVPETMTELQKMTLGVVDFGKGLGMAAPQAAALSEEMMKMAADISSKKMIDFNEALDLVRKGLSGQTKGLKEAGIVIDKAQVQQEAYRLGLIKVGQALTPLGTALATYSVMTRSMSSLQGDANASISDTGRQLAFAKRDLMEFFDATSNLMIPALRVLARVLKSVVDALNSLPDWVRQSIMVFVGLIAVVGPAIYLIAKLAQAFMILRSAIVLLGEGSAIASFLGALAAPEILAVMAGVAVILGIGIALWKKYHKEQSDALTPKLDPLMDVKKLMGIGKGKSGATGMETDNPLQAFQKHAKEMTSAFNDTMDAGGNVFSVFKGIEDLNKEALSLYDRQADKLGEVAQAARQVAKETAGIIATMGIARSSANVNFNRAQVQSALGKASRITTSDAQVRFNIAKQSISDETSLRTREAALRLTDAFNAVRNAAVEMAERFRNTQRDFDKVKSTLTTSYGSKGALGDSVMGGLKAGMTGIMAAFDPFTLAMTAVGKIFQGFQPVLDKLMGPLIALGQVVGTMITPILKLLFIPLKVLGIVTAFLGEIIARVTGAIASVIGNLLVGIGRALNKIPFLHLGSGIEAAGEALRSYASSQYEAADQLKRQRKELQNMKFDDAANGLNGLTNAANGASDSIINMANTFKINLAKFNARDYQKDPRLPLSYSGSVGSSGSQMVSSGQSTSLLPGDTPIANLNIAGQQVAQITWDMVRSSAVRQFGSAKRITDIVIVTG